MTFYFYDLETSGVNPRSARIMQFAGQRTNEKLEPIGQVDEFFIKLTKDVLPEPDAVLLHGITPQKTWQDGISEAEFARKFYDEIVKPGTIFVGYNNIRFDDEFMRFLLYRNFHDPYAWAWKDNCSRWDLLDVVRITRALRPEGIKWPVGSNGESSNRLEMLTTINGIEHSDSHSAVGDVRAMIEFARLLQKHNPKLFSYMCEMRDKRKVRSLVASGDPFAYVSGRYDSRYEKLTVAVCVREFEDSSSALVFDLRNSPNKWAKKSDQELSDALNVRQEEASARLPFKQLQYNRCPAVAPTSVIDGESKARLSIEDKVIREHLDELKNNSKLVDRIMGLFEEKKKSYQTDLIPDDRNPDERLYEGFISDSDRSIANNVVDLKPDQLAQTTPEFTDSRLKALYFLYKARNFPTVLTPEEQKDWQEHVRRRLLGGGDKSQAANFAARLEELASQPSLTKNQQYLLEELKLYAESILPGDLE